MPYVELSQSRAKNSRSSFCYTVITINLTKLYLKYLYIHPQTLTEDNLTLRLLDQQFRTGCGASLDGVVHCV